LIKLFIEMSQKYAKVFMLVDAIDECDRDMIPTTKMLDQLSHDNERVSIALFSRNVPEIEEELQGSSYWRLDIQTADVDVDIDFYIISEMAKRDELVKCGTRIREKIGRKLREKSQGM
jgi:hypothetical protein